MSSIKIPFFIGGEILEREEQKEKAEFHNKTVEVVSPRLSSADLEKIKKTKENAESLHELGSEEIISFLLKAREKWKKGAALREDAEKTVSEITGYSKQMVEFSFQYIDSMLTRDHLKLLLDTELGNKSLIDEWIEKGEAYVHCQPKGTVLHILAGNAPSISILSLIRGLLTKNVNVLKTPSGDPATLPYFVQTFKQVDPEHPITKSTSVIHWKSSDEEVLDEFIDLSDAVCVWGGGEAVEAVRDRAKGKELLEFGPRRGVQMIGSKTLSEEEALQSASQKAAHDLVIFDQEACFSPQLCFIEGNKEDAKKFSQKLKGALEHEATKLPKGIKSLQHSASIGHLKSYSVFLGNEILHSEDKDHMIVITEKTKHTKSHPLGRTLFVIPINDLRDAVDELDRETQVVAIEPFSRAYEFREKLTLKGVDRITHLGKMPYFAAGSPHDGIYPLARLVRWVKSR